MPREKEREREREREIQGDRKKPTKRKLIEMRYDW